MAVEKQVPAESTYNQEQLKEFIERLRDQAGSGQAPKGLKVGNDVKSNPELAKYFEDEAFTALPLDFVAAPQQLTAAEVDLLLEAPSVRSDVIGFAEKVVLGDSGMTFSLTPGGVNLLMDAVMNQDPVTGKGIADQLADAFSVAHLP
ncbi:MAG: hypothetical protein ACT4TC_20280 [Myxococcaceae bacterium]